MRVQVRAPLQLMNLSNIYTSREMFYLWLLQEGSPGSDTSPLYMPSTARRLRSWGHCKLHGVVDIAPMTSTDIHASLLRLRLGVITYGVAVDLIDGELCNDARPKSYLKRNSSGGFSAKSRCINVGQNCRFTSTWSLGVDQALEHIVDE